MPKRLMIEDMRRLARRRGGKCLSKRYGNAYQRLRWRCAKGHEWEAAPVGVKYGGTWCPRCARARIGEAARRRAKESRQRQKKAVQFHTMVRKTASIDSEGLIYQV